MPQKLTKVDKGDISQSAPFYHLELTSEQLDLARRTYNIAGKFIEPTFEGWERGFLADLHPDHELRNWLGISNALQAYCEEHGAQPRRELVLCLMGFVNGSECRSGLSKTVFEGLRRVYDAARSAMRQRVLDEGGEDIGMVSPISLIKCSGPPFELRHSPDLTEHRAKVLAELHMGELRRGEAVITEGVLLLGLDRATAEDRGLPVSNDLELVVLACLADGPHAGFVNGIASGEQFKDPYATPPLLEPPEDPEIAALPRDLLDPEMRGQAESASIWRGFDVSHGGWTIFFGRERLEQIIESGVASEESVFSFWYDQRTGSLEFWVAACEAVRGSCEYGSR